MVSKGHWKMLLCVRLKNIITSFYERTDLKQSILLKGIHLIINRAKKDIASLNAGIFNADGGLMNNYKCEVYFKQTLIKPYNF